MKTTELNKILKSHKLWLDNFRMKGTRANLSGANLSGANLSGANLFRANLSKTIYENCTIISFQFKKHIATFYNKDRLDIGCISKPVAQWIKDYKIEGKNNRYSSKEIEKYGEFIKMVSKLK